MAKIAQCGYGSSGQGLGKTKDGYTYVVNDNVRTGDVIQVVSTSRAGRKFGTTAVPLHAYKEGSVKGNLAKQESESAGVSPTQAYSGKELGVSASKQKPTQKQEMQFYKDQKPQSPYVQETRGGNIAMYKQNNPEAKLTEKAQENFETYSKKYMKQGD